MAKKSSTNAVKKLDKQIDELKKNSNSKDDKTPVVSKKELKEGIEKAKKTVSSKKTTNSKKDSTTKKKSSTKKASTTKKTTAKKTTGSKITKKRKTTTKAKKEAVIVVPTKDVKPEEPVKKVDKPVRDDVVVTPSKKKKKKTPEKKNDSVKDDVLVTPDKSEKKEAAKTEVESKKEISESEKTKRILSKEKKFQFVQDTKEEDIEEYKFAEDIENDINNGKYIDKAKILIDKSNEGKTNKVKRKRKGKNKYIIDLESTREYKDLERDLRSLYDKTNDIIDDIEKPSKDEIIDINKLDIHEKDDEEEKKGFLDHISQKVLNVFIAVLSVIFIILLIIVIGFIIYVSTV